MQKDFICGKTSNLVFGSPGIFLKSESAAPNFSSFCQFDKDSIQFRFWLWLVLLQFDEENKQSNGHSETKVLMQKKGQFVDNIRLCLDEI